MKKLYHIILSFHKEVAFRDEEDYLRAINILAITCLRTGSMLGAFSIMSDHIHFTVYTDDPATFVNRLKRSYIQYFNKKYNRHGRLGKYGFHKVEVVGPFHIEVCNSYVLRNATHHGITHTPFGYPFNSAACYFSKQLGQKYLGSIDFSKYKNFCFLPANYRLKQECYLNHTGMIRPELFIEIALTEKQFMSARAYNYCMTRFTSEEWLRSQENDNNGNKPITLSDLESPYSTSIDQMLENERSRFNENRLQDIDVCQIIDTRYLKKYKVRSYTELSDSQKSYILNELSAKRDCTKRQVARCLGLAIPQDGKSR